ncbi:MAG: cupin domain-containing protein [Puniceicoccales bacterium]|jgi:quercetin dioxygenase-like cupin family protein|nr:cupin domain-containing protein [Puniceicoccales bacterium]
MFSTQAGTEPARCTLSREKAAAIVRDFRDTYLRLAGDVREDLAAELRHVVAELDAIDFSVADASLLAPSGHPVAARFAMLANPTAAASSGNTGPGPCPRDEAAARLLALVQPWLGALPWRYSYDEKASPPGLGRRMAWAELVGPIAPFRSEKVCFGLTAIGPGLLYPAHRHPATETYYVLHGDALWTAAGVPLTHRPGALILHPPNIHHSMQTTATPLLAAYTWSGDVHTLSSYC